MATAREVLQLVITGDARGGIQAIQQTGATARTELAGVERSARSMSTQMLAVSAGMAALGGAGLFGLSRLSKGFVDTASESIVLQRSIGGTAEEVSAFVFAAKSSEVSADALTASMGRLAKAAKGTAGKKLLDELGVASQNRSTIDMFKDLSSVFESMPDGMEKTAAVLTLFGRSGEQMLPFLNRGGQGIDDLMHKADELGATLSGKTLGDVDAYRESLERLGTSGEALKMQIGKSVFPLFAKGADTAAGSIEQLAKWLGQVPEPLRNTVGAMAGVGSAGLLALGSLGMMAGAVQKVTAGFRDSEGVLNNWGRAAKGVGMVAGVAGGVAGIVAFADGINKATVNSLQLAAALDDVKAQALTTGETSGAALAKIAEESDGIVSKGVDILTGWMRLGQFNPAKSFDVDGVTIQIDSMRRALAELDKDGNTEVLESVLDALDRATKNKSSGSGTAIKELAGLVGDYRSKLESAKRAADATADSTEGVGDAAHSASRGLDRAAYSVSQFGDELTKTKSDIEQWIDAMNGAFDPMLAALDAQDRLADAQKRLGDVARTDGKAIIDATKNLARAQSDLNRVLNDDPLFGMKQVSPTKQLAEARSDLAKANARLVKNPGDAGALTARDKAIQDLEFANRRVQDAKRQGEQRAQAIRDASDRVADAQQRLNEVQADHGINSEDYARASRDVIKANIEVETSMARLLNEWVQHPEKIGEINGKLDDWIAKGGPVGAAAKNMKGQFEQLRIEVEKTGKQFRDFTTDMLEDISKWPDPLDYWAKREVSGRVQNKQIGSIDYLENAKQAAIRNAFPQLRFSEGGVVPGSGSGDTIPAMLTPGEVVWSRDDIARAGGVSVVEGWRNAGREPVRYAVTPRSNVAGSDGVTVADGPITFDTTVQIVARDDRDAGLAVVRTLRELGVRAGKGLAVGSAFGG